MFLSSIAGSPSPRSLTESSLIDINAIALTSSSDIAYNGNCGSDIRGGFQDVSVELPVL